MAAFLDADGLNIFYSLIAAKFGSGSADGSMKYIVGKYTGTGEDIGEITISDITGTDGAFTDSGNLFYDCALIRGNPIGATSGINAFGIIYAGRGQAKGTGFSLYRDLGESFVTVSMLPVVGACTTKNGDTKTMALKFGETPIGFTPYDPAFTALAPDNAKAKFNAVNTTYEVALLKFSNSAMAT